MRRFMGKMLSWHWEHKQRENTARKVVKTMQGTAKRRRPPQNPTAALTL